MDSFWNDVRAVFRLNFDANVLTYRALLGPPGEPICTRSTATASLPRPGFRPEPAQAELGALKMQLEPLFLFNMLNAFAAVPKTNPDAAEGMIFQLSDSLRVMLKNMGRSDVTLREELESLERYLAIEKTCFQDRLSTRFRILTEVLDVCVPNLLLQPPLENAIRHGIAKDRRAGRVEVSATHEKGRLLLRVTDDGPGAPLGRVNEGIAMTNTRERLRLLDGDACSLEYGTLRAEAFALPLAAARVPRSEPLSP